jgi:hypothetical protein
MMIKSKLSRIETWCASLLFLSIIFLVPHNCWGISLDDYECDDTSGEARVIDINSDTAQSHNFHDSGDADFVKFYGLSGKDYTVKVLNAESNCDAVLDLFDSEENLLRHYDPLGNHKGEDKTFTWSCTQNGIYYVKVTEAYSDFGENTGYELKVYFSVGVLNGLIEGSIRSGTLTGPVIPDAIVTIGGEGSGISHLDGYYLVILRPDAYTLQAIAYKHYPYTGTVNVPEGVPYEFNIVMDPKPPVMPSLMLLLGD